MTSTTTATAKTSDLPFEWGFHYSGPLAEVSDARCVTCNAARSHECPAHGSQRLSGCAHCIAADGGGCHAHWGLAKALAHFENPETGALSDEARSDYERAKVIVLDEIAAPSGKRAVVVTMRGSGPAHLKGEREFFVKVDRR